MVKPQTLGIQLIHITVLAVVEYSLDVQSIYHVQYYIPKHSLNIYKKNIIATLKFNLYLSRFENKQKI